MASNQKAIRNKQIKQWDELADSVIINDAVTKGTFIRLCISYLAKRNNLTIEDYKPYFDREVNKYVERMLSNNQILKAELVMNNVNRSYKYFFYDYALRSSNEQISLAIIEYLTKKFSDFELKRNEYRIAFFAIQHIQSTPELQAKCEEIGIVPQDLEKFYLCPAEERNKLITLVFFNTEDCRLQSCLSKTAVWNYVLRQQNDYCLELWLNALDHKRLNAPLPMMDNNFDFILMTNFFNWDIDDSMKKILCELKWKPRTEDIMNKFMRIGILLNDGDIEIENVIQKLCNLEVLTVDNEILMGPETANALIRTLKSYNLLQYLTEPYISTSGLKNAAENEQDPSLKKLLQFCIKTKGLNLQNHKDLLSMLNHTAEYLMVNDNKFYEKNPILYLTKVLLEDGNILAVEHRDILKKLVFFKNFLPKFEQSECEIDYKNSLDTLVMTQMGLSLPALRESFGDEGCSFENTLLQNKYGLNFQTNYTMYIRKNRPAYAFYRFHIDQLHNFGRISHTARNVAAQTALEIAFENPYDKQKISSAILFAEMLGFNTCKARAIFASFSKLDLKGKTHWSRDEIHDAILETLMSTDLSAADKNVLEASKLITSEKQIHKLKPVLDHFAKGNNWLNFALLLSFWNVPRDKAYAATYDLFEDKNLEYNINRALYWSKNQSALDRRHLNKSNLMNFKDLPVGCFLDEETDNDLFSIILLCTTIPECDPKFTKMFTFKNWLSYWEQKDVPNISCTCFNLLRKSIEMKWPILSVLSATVNLEITAYGWLTWLMIVSEITQIDDDELNSFQAVAKNIIERCVTGGFVRILHTSLEIFYPTTPFLMFTEYLLKTAENIFSKDTSQLIINFFNRLKEGPSHLGMFTNTEEISEFVVHLILVHVKNFKSLNTQRLLMYTLRDLNIQMVNDIYDFTLISLISEIVNSVGIEIDFDDFNTKSKSVAEIKTVTDTLIDTLVSLTHFKEAIELADLLGEPKGTIIMDQWTYQYENEKGFSFKQCEEDLNIHTLPPHVLINFYIHLASKYNFEDVRKYNILRLAMDVKKKQHLLPTDFSYADIIELEMYLSLLQCPEEISQLEIYHSAFYDTVMKVERNILFKSFLELKEMAGIEKIRDLYLDPLTDDFEKRLTDLINYLLDAGDIVQAFRVQVIFNFWTTDLHYIVFMMGLAEGLTTTNNLTEEEKMNLNSYSADAISKFTKQTLLTAQRRKYTISSAELDATSSFEANSFNEFEEFISSARQETIKTLQCIATQVKHGCVIANRVVLVARIAMYLDKEYVDVLKVKEASLLLHNAIEIGISNKLMMINDIFKSMAMTPLEIAEYISWKITESLLESVFYITQKPVQNVEDCSVSIWGYDLTKDFHLFLEICPNTTYVGQSFLRYWDALQYYRKGDTEEEANMIDITSREISPKLEKLKTVIQKKVFSNKKQNTVKVEMLIKAHDCFIHECSMEGIQNVLHRTKVINLHLAKAQSWRLIVRLLVGIGRYRDMVYCFETLVKHEQFEMLLGNFSEPQSNRLRQAILSYLQEYHPSNEEFFRLTAIYFRMYKQLAEMSEKQGNTAIAMAISRYQTNSDEECYHQLIGTEANDSLLIRLSDTSCQITYLACSSQISQELDDAMMQYANAAENYLMDNMLNHALKMANKAELVAMQIHLVSVGIENKKGICVNVLMVSSLDAFRGLVITELSVPQSMILAKSYNYEVPWSEAILRQYVLNGSAEYLQDFMNRMELTDELIESVIKHVQHLPMPVALQSEPQVINLVSLVSSVAIKYRLASILGLKNIISRIINDQASIYYLKDTNYGRNKIFNDKY